jgi:putative ABC transport system substrate-binding protein
MERTKEAAAKLGMELVTVPANTSSEVPDAALSMMSQGIDAVCQIAGNLTAASFPSLVRAAEAARVPIFAFQSNQAYEGAAVVVARDYYDGGREAAHLAVRVMRGENPSQIPFQPLRTTRIFVNQKAADRAGLKIPDTVLRTATKVIKN